MKPRWKIRREPDWQSWHQFRWALYLDGNKVAAFYIWENALTFVDDWYYDQKLRGAS